MSRVHTIRALGDNFIYVCEYAAGKAFVVDPSEASAVTKQAETEGLEVTHVLLTHHHFDHTDGAGRLKETIGCGLIGSDAKCIAGVDQVVSDGDVLSFGEWQVEVIATPGHTNTSVCYYKRPSRNQPGVVFTGDTMFVGGCGRILECDVEAMWKSLNRLAALPTETLVYCGHDYTEENYEFALQFEADNVDLRKRLAEVRRTDRVVPSTIGQERLTNIFLRADASEVKAALGMPDASAVEVFAVLRRRKDLF